ncbi:MucB/RseB C-terminal domain-containing protein [Motiliproteus sediminis]|uniref:MucB/RseB C-terminal domain-containing protein n=1 Tax=Motiliproteus sediminis TaxID=1468178 RepID=UPI001AF01837|nr:MucB/RseB C-terminal domain-containing protein [Motiliproteus sediminis]
MSESVKQSLSALMDDEADQFEVRRVLQQMDDDAADTWARYQVAGAVLRGESVRSEDVQISGAVWKALDEEPVYQQKASLKGFWKPLGSVAVAASVTAMVMFGAQSYTPDTAPQVASSGVGVLPAPTPSRSGLVPAQYGRSNELARHPALGEQDVIRLSSSMEYYIHQHHALMRERAEKWSAGWIPGEFKQVRHDVMPDSEVMLYSNGRTAISVSVEPFGKRKARAGAIQEGGTVAFGKQVGDQFVTVVGDLPLMMADRIASSVALVER